MNSTSRITAIVATVLFISASSWAGELSPFTASYEIHHGKSKIGDSQKALTYPGDGSYLFTSSDEISVAIYHQKIDEKSAGKITSSGYQPSQYHVVTNKKPTFSQQDFTTGLQDNLSQTLMLSYSLFNGEKAETVQLVTAQGQQTYEFTVVESGGTLDTALGKQDVVQVRFNDDKGNQVDVWLASQYEYLPVQYQISKGGKTTGMIYIEAADMKQPGS